MSTYIFKLKNCGLTFTLKNMDSDEKKAKERFANCLPEGYSLSDFDVIKEKPCPYCHEQADHYAEPIVGDFNDIGSGLVHCINGWYFESWDYDVAKTSDVPATTCPVCGRDLGEDD